VRTSDCERGAKDVVNAGTAAWFVALDFVICGAAADVFIAAVRDGVVLDLINAGIPFTCHAGNNITEKGSRSTAIREKVRTMCWVAAERFFIMNAALQAKVSSTVDFKTVSRSMANDGENVCMAYLPSCCAFLINCERYCLSLLESVLSDISSRAATACSGEPPKNVFTMCCRALARTWRVSSAGR
jgi:hypothetical protein